MGSFRLSQLAKRDLLEIRDYTRREWGSNQATKYILDLREFCQTLADNPMLGRACEEIRPGLRRLEHGRHVVFYRVGPKSVLIARLLHQRTLPSAARIG